MSEIEIQKAIRKNWFIIGILSFPYIVGVLLSFVSNIRDTTYNYSGYIKSNEPQYIMFIEFTPQCKFDEKPLLFSSPSGSYYDIYILPQGDIDIRVTEAGRYSKDILLYESTYQAQSYHLDFLSEQLQQYSPVPINE